MDLADLSYMPGELDHKKDTKEVGKIKREHDSVDDFEHLDPDSPIETKQTNVTSHQTEKLVSGSGIMPENKSSLDDLDTLAANDSDSNLDIGLAKSSSFKQSDPLSAPPGAGTTAKTEDLLNLETTHDLVVKNEETITANTEDLLNLETPRDALVKNEETLDDIKTLHSSFIESESMMNGRNVVEHEKDSLKVEKMSSDNPDNNSSSSFPSVIQDENKELIRPQVDDSIFGKEISMKEADALSQYDIKVGKKESSPLLDSDNEEQKDDANIVSGENDESLASFGPELTKPQVNISSGTMPLEPLIPSKDLPQKSHNNESELVQNFQHENVDKNSSDEPNDSKYIEYSLDNPYIAICPAKPETPEENPSRKMPSVSDLDDIIGPEDVFKRIGLVEALVYWRDPKKSGVVFGGVMAILLSLCYMSLISVVAYSSLLVLVGTIAFRIYKNIMQAVQKTSEGHPFKEFLELELTLPQEKVREIADLGVAHANAAVRELRRLFLVEDLIDSIKFGVCLWCLTYVGAIFNGMTLVILSFVALFTVPKIYENNKASIDQYIEMGRSKVAEITTKVKAAVPIGKKEEKDKEQ